MLFCFVMFWLVVSNYNLLMMVKEHDSDLNCKNQLNRFDCKQVRTQRSKNSKRFI